MKLHLPCALRSALFACFTVALTAPAWAEGEGYHWDGDQCVITSASPGSIDILADKSGDNGIFIRSTDGSYAATDEVKTATIDALTIGNTRLNIQGHWSNAEGNAFTSLTIGSVVAGSADATALNIYQYNTLNLGDLTGAAQDTPLVSDNITITVSGTLNLSFSNYLSMGSQVVDDNGSLYLTGSWDASKYTESTTIRSGITFGNVDLSGVTVTGLEEGYYGSLSYSEGSISLTIDTAPLVPPVVRAPLPSPETETFTSTGSMGIPTSCMKITGLESFDDSGTVTIRIKGALTNPGYTAESPFVLLLSSKDLGANNPSAVEGTEEGLQDGDFCLYVTSEGELVLHSKDQVGQPGDGFKGYTTYTISTDTCPNWFAGEFDITLQYVSDVGGGVAGVRFVEGMLDLGANASDTSERFNVLFNTVVGTLPSVIVGSWKEDLLDNLYTRLPSGTDGGGSTISAVFVTKQSATWNIQGPGSLDSLLANQYDAELFDQTRDTIHFQQGGSLSVAYSRTGEDNTSTSFGNSITADDGVAVTFKLLENDYLGQRVTLVLEDGEGALNQKFNEEGAFVGGGLTLKGQEGALGGKLVLNNVDDLKNPDSAYLPYELQKIVIEEGLTLEINGTAGLSIDNSKEEHGNSIGKDVSLIKGGRGNFNYIAKDGDQLYAISNANGTLKLQNNMSATIVEASYLTIAGDKSTVSINGTGYVKADSLQVDKDTTLNIGQGSLTVPKGDWENVYLSGTLQSDSFVSVMREGAGIGLFNGLKMTKSTLSSDWATGVGIFGTVGENALTITLGEATNTILGFQPSSTASTQSGTIAVNTLTDSSVSVYTTENSTAKVAPVSSVLLGTSTNNTIQGTGNTLVGSISQNAPAKLIKTAIMVRDGNLTLSNTQLDADSTADVRNGALTLSNVTVTQGTSFSTADGTFTVATTAPDEMTLSGTATGSVLNLTGIALDARALTQETGPDGVVYIEATQNGSITLDETGINIAPAPGMACTLDTSTGDLVIKVMDDTENILNAVTTTATEDKMVGIMEKAYNTNVGGEIAALYDALRDTATYTTAQRQNMMDELASASITMLADSQRRGVTHTINALRNRVVQMGNAQDIEHESNVHAWIEADGSNLEVDEDGAAAGYKYQTWGGTVGAHANMGDFSFGAAVSAAYGDLSSKSADRADGDHDTLSLSLFARHQHKQWVQMAILSFARNEIDVTRHVQDYEAKSDTDGHTITGYYEVGYAMGLNDEYTHVLQPHMSIMLTSASMGGFTESGSIGNAALSYAGEDYVYGTVGIGARYQAVLGTDVNDRLSFFEARAKVVADFGDDTHEAMVHFAGAPGSSVLLTGSEVGKVGLQLGAGVSVPFGMYKTLFFDVDADFRDCATSVSGSFGMRVEF